ncbi:ribonucleoside hydrolase [[Bacillus] enclensis]|uniref:Purine nucleosidase n=1 Tax=[Bacillus] enclensis TaxID=1402860 RepID=A0A0V8H507_9BACI|nr:nucleoside hydrolase [[Bacillus] enclensis]KSU57604.1 ribonucleoside hydrolase [[Bacillus] enclensis]SCC36924.1 purine nucleosidase [[Bacillus] enclensis]
MQTHTKRKIILDCDPGHDDAIAILLAAGHEAIDLIGITTVAGNAELEKTTLNALKVCEIAGIDDVPVLKGNSQPLIRKRETAADIHGDSGMDGPVLPDPLKQAGEEHAVDFIIRTVMESDGDITLVPVGPLTNIAMAMRREPAILSKIQEIVIMGGGTFGNWTPAAEFNIYVDADAAKVVFESGVPITMMGLDLTHQALADRHVRSRIAEIGNPAAGFVSELLTYFRKTYLEFFGFEHPPVHDVCSVAYCIDPTVVETKKLRVDIETKGELTYGMTLVDLHGVTGREPNVNVALKLDHEKFWNMLIETLKQYK